jgi:hypothetical protein
MNTMKKQAALHNHRIIANKEEEPLGPSSDYIRSITLYSVFVMRFSQGWLHEMQAVQ